MKKIVSIIKMAICILPAVTLWTSCSKGFLDIVPKGKVIAQNTGDYDLMFNSGVLPNNSLDVSVPMGDEVIANDSYFFIASTRSQRLFKWSDVIYDPGNFANEMTSQMSLLYVYNKIATEVMFSTGGTDGQKKALLAEAKANRAWTNFWLINMYGKPYNAATAATDPGFPIVTKADVNQNDFSRGTVQNMYDFIIKDLTEAIPDLPVTVNSRIRMGKIATEELLGKVYVFMGRYADAKPLLDSAMVNLANTGSGTPLNTMGLYDLNVTMVPAGTWGYNATSFASSSFSGVPIQANNTEFICCRQASNSWAFSLNEYTISPQTTQLYTSSDKRLNFFTAKPYGVSTAYPLANALRRNSPAYVQNGMTIPELYLLRAECAARLNDIAGAKADLLALRSKRMSAVDAAIPAGLSQTQLIQFVLEERIREFALMGYRWYDMRRLSVDPLYSSTTYTHTLYSATGAVSSTYTLRPARFTLQFPQAVIDQNPGMQNNP